MSAADNDLPELDPDEVAVVGFKWANWLASIGESALDESVFAVSSRLVLGDAVVEVTKGGITVTPPAPTIDGSTHVTAAHVWTDDATAKLGDEVIITNTVRVGQRVRQKSLRMRVANL